MATFRSLIRRALILLIAIYFVSDGYKRWTDSETYSNKLSKDYALLERKTVEVLGFSLIDAEFVAINKRQIITTLSIVEMLSAAYFAIT